MRKFFLAALAAAVTLPLIPISTASAQNRQEWREDWREYRQDRRGDRRDFRRDRRDFRRGFHRRGDWWYYNGYRGYRHYRPGWREYNGWWFPLAAFAAGAIVTGAIVDNDYGGNNWNAHVRWCYAKYRSYREWDNTYQPYHGPRRECYSPYS